MTVKEKHSRKGHPYPFKIGFRAMERLQAALFHTILQDVAAGIQVRRPGGLNEISKNLRNDGLPKTHEDEAWEYIKKYKDEVIEIPYQNVVLQMFATWDWYAGQMKDFVSHGLHELGEFPQLSGPLKKSWKNFSRKPIELQLPVLPNVAGVSIDIVDSTKNSLKELRLARNLGIHNLWTVDEKYQRLTATGPWEIGELRKLPVPELLKWQAAINDVITKISVAMSKRFVAVEVDV